MVEPRADDKAALGTPSTVDALAEMKPPGLVTLTYDQPLVTALRSWDGGLVAVAEHLYRLDPFGHPGTTRGARITIPGATRVVDVAMYGALPVALVETSRGLALAAHRGSSWSIEPVPSPSRPGAEVILTADESTLVLLHARQVNILRDGVWSTRPVGTGPFATTLASLHVPPKHTMIAGGRLFVGWDHGEWGGALISLDLEKGTWTAYPDFKLPVRALARGVDGKPWAASGLSHLVMTEATLSRLDARGWTTIARVAGSYPIGRDPLVTARLGWDLPLASFDGMAFDDRGRLHVVTRRLGVLRRDDDHWTQLTPDWTQLKGPDDSPLGNLSGLVVHGSLVVIATWGTGVVVWDVDTGKVRPIPFEPRQPR